MLKKQTKIIRAVIPLRRGILFEKVRCIDLYLYRVAKFKVSEMFTLVWKEYGSCISSIFSC